MAAISCKGYRSHFVLQRMFVGDGKVQAEKVDDLTVRFTIPEPSASYLEILGKLLLIPEHAFDGNTDIASAEANLTDIGSGPYKLVEFKDGESLVLEKFEDYYGDQPQIDQIVFKVISDPSAQEVAFKNGEINYMVVSSDASAAEMEKTEGVELHKLAESSGLAGKTIKLYYNTDRSYMEATALLIQEQLKAINVTVNVEGIDANGFFDVVFTDQDE